MTCVPEFLVWLATNTMAFMFGVGAALYFYRETR